MEGVYVRIRKPLLFLIVLFLLIVSGCRNNSNQTIQGQQSSPIDENLQPSSKLIENRKIYEYGQDEPITHIYVTILHSTDGKPYTFQDLNHWYDFNSIKSDSPSLDVMVQEGTEKGPGKGDIIFQKDVVNSTIEIRGNSTRIGAQKSYKLKLLDSAGLWRGQKTLNLNKHVNDMTRIRNKLSFDYYKLIPDMTSLRTQFVHLHIKDLTAKTPDKVFVDYGLFTHVEQVNERFLASRGLDANGQLYKATNFEFYRYPDQLKLESDPDYQRDDFESILEIKGNKDHAKLLKMLDDVNNEALNINDVFNQHFDRDNYLTWVASNILMGNIDTNSQNFYLYSPLNSEKWYILPWDYDDSWGIHNEGLSKDKSLRDWQSGIGTYWGGVLHKRFFKDFKNVEALNEKIEGLSKVINANQTIILINQYYDVVKPFINRPPDFNHLPYKAEQFDTLFNRLPLVSEANKQDYFKKLENPMPIYLSESKIGDGKYLFTWDYSFDLQGDEITYDFQLSRDPNFSNVVNEKRDMSETKLTVNGLTPGRYFWRVIVKDNKNNQQIAFDYYEDEAGDVFNGIRELIVR
jgi:spore coat protein H